MAGAGSQKLVIGDSTLRDIDEKHKFGHGAH
jgi:hypothetical protein